MKELLKNGDLVVGYHYTFLVYGNDARQNKTKLVFHSTRISCNKSVLLFCSINDSVISAEIHIKL